MSKLFSVKGWRAHFRAMGQRCRRGCPHWNGNECAAPDRCLYTERVDVEIEAANAGAALDALAKPEWQWASVTVAEVSPARQMETSGAAPLFNLDEYGL